MDNKGKKITRFSLITLGLLIIAFLLFGIPFIVHDWFPTIIMLSLFGVIGALIGFINLVAWAWKKSLIQQNNEDK